MKEKEIIRNIGIGTIPLCLGIFAITWIISRNVIVSAIIPILLFFVSVYSNIGKYFDDKKREKAGVIKLKFNSIKVYELIAPNDSVAPSLCFEINENKYLLLNGQWMYDKEIYGKEAEKYYDSESDIFNCYKKPFSFPANEFEIWISSLDEQPAKIVVLGDYIEPEQVGWRTPKKYCNKQFAIIDKNELETG